MKRAELVKRLSLQMDVTKKEADLYVVAFLGFNHGELLYR